MSIADKKKQTLMRRRKRAIVLSVIAIIILAIALVFVMDYVQTFTFEDVDGTEYYIRKKDGVYAMYDAKRVMLTYDAEQDCYVTAAGTLVQIDPETGAHKIIAIVDTEYTEQYDTSKSKIMMFPRLKSADIMQISITNADDGYTFARYDLEKNQFSKDANFIVMNSPATTYDAEKFAALYVNTGYTLCTLKLEDPIKDANGEFTEYGLAPQTRLDEDGNAYEYKPSYYVISDTSGISHKVIIGDMLPTGDGYYAQYVGIDKDGKETKRDAVYVLDKNTGDCINATVEYYISPMFCYPMSLTNYFDVENFEIYVRQKNARPGDDSDKLYGDPVVGFTYLDLANRENTLQANYPYEFTNVKLDGYYPSSQAIIDKCLYGLYTPSVVELHKLAPSVEDFVEFGFYAPVTDEDGEAVLNKDGKQEYALFADYTFSYDFDVVDGDSSYTVNQKIIVSDERWDEEEGEYVKNGNYYVYCTLLQRNSDGSLSATGLYNMIVEVEGHSLNFLTWDGYEWINNSYFQSNIAYVTDLKIESPSYSASFKLDNSASDSSSGTSSAYIKVNASDSDGKSASTFNKMQVTDSDGYIWTITANELSVANAAGKQMSVAEGTLYYSHNALGRQVRCHSKYIVCKDARVEVTENTVRILYNNGEEKTYVRYQTDLFRKFYETLTYSTIVESYVFDPADESALLNDPAAHLLTMTVTTRDVNGEEKTTTYSFYQIPGASRKAYITINGNGGFYVMRSRVDKFITDAQKFFALDPSIDFKAKN